jgi:hypothetical protein
MAYSCGRRCEEQNRADDRHGNELPSKGGHDFQTAATRTSQVHKDYVECLCHRSEERSLTSALDSDIEPFVIQALSKGLRHLPLVFDYQYPHGSGSLAGQR